MPSNRGNEWISFSRAVLTHIEEYTVPQYGDAPNDQLAQEWSYADCMLAIRKYANRAGKNSRGAVEAERDLVKIAHYACVALSKLRKEAKP
ncbi:MAG: hypothetical protein WC455_21335 [Dehalococcoidia bacterium]|jgi:hypothetical protein